jgi:hypothetical protein
MFAAFELTPGDGRLTASKRLALFDPKADDIA